MSQKYIKSPNTSGFTSVSASSGKAPSWGYGGGWSSSLKKAIKAKGQTGATGALGSGGGGGSSQNYVERLFQQEVARRAAEAKRLAAIKAQKEAASKSARVKAARQAALRQKQIIESQKKILLLKKNLTAKQRKSYQEISRVAALQNLKSQGKTLTPQAKQLIKKYSQPQIVKVPKSNNITALQQTKTRKNVPSGISKVADIISGGYFTNRELQKRQEEINKKIVEYNKKYSGKLSETQYNKSLKELQKIEESKEKLNKEIEKFNKSFKREVIGGYIWGIGKSAIGAKQKEYLTSERGIEETESRINSIKNKIKNSSGPKKVYYQTILQYNKTFLKSQKKGTVQGISAGTVPFIPESAMQTTNIAFIGKQIRIGNKIKTDVMFIQGKKTLGIAKGVTIVKGKKASSLILGRTGVRTLRGRIKTSALKSPSFSFKKIKSFVNLEKGATKSSSFKIKSTIDLLKKNKKIGTINEIKTNLKGLLQVGVGKTAVINGKRFYKISKLTGKGKKVKGIKVNDFASISSVFTKNELSVIIGKTITSQRNKANFIGLIKGTSNIEKNFKLSQTQKLQYNKAMQKIFSSVAGALAKKSKTGDIANINTLAKIVKDIKINIASSPSKIKVMTDKQKTKTITQQQAKQINSTLPTLKVKSKQKLTPKNVQKIKQQVKQKIKQITKQEQKLKQKQTQKQTQKQKQIQRQKLKLLSKQKQKLKQVGKFFSPSLVIRSGGTRLILPPIKKRKKRKIKKQKPSTIPVFHVYGKSGKRFVKISTKPLKRNDALSKGTYAIDNTTSKQFKIVPAGKTKKPGMLRKGEKNYFNRRGYKLREYKVKKGKAYKIKPKYIEKTKYGIDTRGEKKGLTIAKYVKQQKRGGKKINIKRKKRKLTPTQRKVMLKNLAKARRALNRRRKKGGNK